MRTILDEIFAGPASFFYVFDLRSSNYFEDWFCCNDNKITEFEMVDTKNSFTAYVVIY